MCAASDDASEGVEAHAAEDAADAAALDIHIDHDGDRAVVTVRGEIDLYTAPQLEDVLRGASSASDAPLVIVDLSGVRFMDSTGLGALVRARQRILDLGGRLTVASPSPQVRRLLDITGLAEVLSAGPDAS